MKRIESNRVISGRSVQVQGTDLNQVNKALRKLKKIMTNENIINEVRERQTYEKPTAARKKAKAAARKREQNQQQKNSVQRTRLY